MYRLINVLDTKTNQDSKVYKIQSLLGQVKGSEELVSMLPVFNGSVTSLGDEFRGKLAQNNGINSKVG